MSNVTTIVLLTSIDEDVFVEKVNAFLEGRGCGPLGKLPVAEAGGNRHMYVDVFAGAYNHAGFRPDEFITMLGESMSALVESAGDASATVITDGGDHIQWAANIW